MARLYHQSRPGFVHLWVAVLMLVLIGLTGLALDTGYSVLVAGQLQSSADAAALAAAQLVRLDEAESRQAAVTYGAANTAAGESVQLDANEANTPTGDVVLGRYNRLTGVFNPAPGSPNAVQVNARRTDAALGGPVALIFGPVFGVDTIAISRTAIAMTDGSAAAGLAVLHPTQRGALSVGGDVTLVVNGGSIHVNSDHSTAAIFTGGASIEADELNVVGGVAFNGSSIYEGAINLGDPPIPDPLAWLPAPSPGPTMSEGSFTVGPGETVTLNPGYYPGGVDVRGTANLLPGIYVIDGGLTINSQATVNAEGVMLYIKSGSLRMNAGAAINLSPPDPEEHSFPGAGTYEGIAFFQARTNTTSADVELSETSVFSGTLYFPEAGVKVTANGDNYLARLIASTFDFAGVGRLSIDYTGGTQAAGNKPFLVR